MRIEKPVLPKLRDPGTAAAVQVSENDPGIRIFVRDRVIRIEGAAQGGGAAVTFASFSFAGRTLSVDLQRGMRPSEILEQLEAQLPAGYVVEGTAAGGFQIIAGRRPPSHTSAIQAAFVKRGPLTPHDVRHAFGAALAGGPTLSAEDKLTLAREWARLFDGVGWHATPDAQREFTRLQRRFGVPVLPAD